MKTKHIIIGLVIILIVLFLMQKKEHAGSVPVTTVLSNEAIQNLAKVYADTNTTATFNNIKATGNINAKNIVIDEEITGNGATKLIQDTRSNKINNRKPVILTIQVGSSKIPIVDLSGNTFASNQWICRIISSASDTALINTDTVNKPGLVIGIRNGKWWIVNFSGWGIWQQATVEFIPIHGPIEDYYDLKSGFHPSIAIDSVLNSATTNSNVSVGWSTGPANNGYSVYSSESKRFVEVAPPLA